METAATGRPSYQGIYRQVVDTAGYTLALTVWSTEIVTLKQDRPIAVQLVIIRPQTLEVGITCGSRRVKHLLQVALSRAGLSIDDKET